MKHLFKSQSLAIGLAMFSMFFGAGNVIFPLALGQYAGDKNLYAILGLILTAAIMPMAGVFAIILFGGNYRSFFGRLGRIPGLLLGLTTISLLGPFGSTPRCIALAYTTLSRTFTSLSPVSFSIVACIIIFMFAFRKNHLLTLLGWVLTPVLLISLAAIIIVGLIRTPSIEISDHTNLSMFLHGLKEGYNTMDLLASFFFTSTILNILKQRSEKECEGSCNYTRTVFKASIISVFLLSAIYAGFSYIAAFHASGLAIDSKDQLLAAIITKLAGPYAGLLVCITVAFSCLTTAIALISAFADFIRKEIFEEKISYEMTLAGALLLTCFVSTFQFTGISAFLGPVLEICYPGLIVLTFLNIAYCLRKLKLAAEPLSKV